MADAAKPRSGYLVTALTRFTVDTSPFGTTPAGDAVEVFTVTNAQGVAVRATSYGAIIVSILIPDRAGRPGDVVLGYDTLDEYLRDSAYLGAVVGRYANRIAGARFTLDGTTYRLAANDGRNHLHGGPKGFDSFVMNIAYDAIDVMPVSRTHERRIFASGTASVACASG